MLENGEGIPNDIREKREILARQGLFEGGLACVDSLGEKSKSETVDLKVGIEHLNRAPCDSCNFRIECTVVAKQINGVRIAG